MPKFLLMVNYDNGVVDTSMNEWEPDEVRAHMNYCEILGRELIGSGEQIQFVALADPRLARIVRSDGIGPPVVTDGPFPESKEVLAGFQVVDVESEARAIEIAAAVSAVPGPGGVPIQQPVEVRQVMDESGGDEHRGDRKRLPRARGHHGPAHQPRQAAYPGLRRALRHAATGQQ